MTIVRVKHSKTIGHTPGALVDGQLAINQQDGKLFWPDGSNITQSLDLRNPSCQDAPSDSDDSLRLAPTSFVQDLIASLVDTAPGTLDTLAKLATAINNDPSFATTINNALTNRLRVDSAQGLPGTNQDIALANLGISKSVLRYDIAQSLTSGQKTQAQNNLGVSPSLQFNPRSGRLALSGTLTGVTGGGNKSQNIAFVPEQGAFVKVNGTIYRIPDAGVSAAINSTYLEGVAAQSLAMNTLYYVFAFDSGSSVLALDFRKARANINNSLQSGGNATHAISIDTNNAGTEVLVPNYAAPATRDETRTLVGMVYISGIDLYFYDSQVRRFVASWFNRQAVSQVTNFSLANTNSGGTFVQLTNVVGLTWGSDDVGVFDDGYVYIGNYPGGFAEIFITADQVYPTAGYTSLTAVSVAGGGSPGTAGQLGYFPINNNASARLAEGLHTFYLMGENGASVVSWSVNLQTVLRI